MKLKEMLEFKPVVPKDIWNGVNVGAAKNRDLLRESRKLLSKQIGIKGLMSQQPIQKRPKRGTHKVLPYTDIAYKPLT